MREYYYLSQLDSSPFDISIEDVLHLGATSQLNIYVYVDSWVQLTSLHNGELAGEEQFYLKLIGTDLSEVEKQYVSWLSSPATTRERTTGLSNVLSISLATADDRFDGIIPIRAPLFREGTPPYVVRAQDNQGQPLSCHSSELLCWTEDLQRISQVQAHKGTMEKFLIGSKPMAQPKNNQDLGTNERNTLLRLILGMAIQKYDYDPEAARNAATGTNAGSIAADLENLGLSVDKKTVKKYLTEAAKELPPSR